MKAKLYAYVVVNAALIAALIALPVKTVAAKEPHKASTRDELEIAVESAKPGDVIEITADIPMTHCLFIKGKSLTIRSGKEGGVHSLKRTEQYFGQLIKIEQSNVIFEDIIIDGNKNGAGERTEYLLSALDSGITLLSGAVLQNNSGAGVRAGPRTAAGERPRADRDAPFLRGRACQRRRQENSHERDDRWPPHRRASAKIRYENSNSLRLQPAGSNPGPKRSSGDRKL